MATEDLSVQLRKAVSGRNWETVITILKSDVEKHREIIITDKEETSLMVAVQRNMKKSQMERLVDNVPDNSDVLTLVNVCGNTALHIAVEKGNIEAVKILIKKEPDLLKITNNEDMLPCDLACERSNEKIIRYILSEVTDRKQYAGNESHNLIRFALNAELYDLVLDVLKKNQKLAFKKDELGVTSPLPVLAHHPSAFESQTSLPFFYSCVPITILDEEKVLLKLSHSSSHATGPGCIWRMLRKVPCIRKAIRMKSKHHHASELMKYLVNDIEDSDSKKELLKQLLLMGARNGITEIVETILKHDR